MRGTTGIRWGMGIVTAAAMTLLPMAAMARKHKLLNAAAKRALD